MNVKEVIEKKITNGLSSLVSAEIILSITNNIASLNPDKPDDGSSCFIAFDNAGKRLKLKTGRFLTRKLALNNYACDEVLRNLATELNKELFQAEDEDSGVKLFKGEDITSNYRDEIGGTSCMTGGCAEYTLLYEMNPDKFSQAVAILGNDTARAIVSKLDNGKFIMDRIYHTDSNLAVTLREYAEKQGWYRYNGSQVIDSEGNEITDYSELIVSNLSFENGHIPYMDTLRYYKINSKNKMNIFHSRSKFSYDGSLDNIDGHISNCEFTCSNCGNGVDEDNTYSPECGDGVYCENCYSQLFTRCDICEEDVFSGDANFIEAEDITVCNCCKDNYITECERCEAECRDNHRLYKMEEILCSSCRYELYYKCKACGVYKKIECAEEELQHKLCREHFLEKHSLFTAYKKPLELYEIAEIALNKLEAPWY